MLRDRTDPRAALWRIAAGQRGYFTAAQALASGYSYQAQHYHARRNWTLVDRGIYRYREFDDLPGGASDHLVRWSLWSKGRAVVSHTTALSLHDLGSAHPSEIHLTVPPGFRQKDDTVILHRADLSADEIADSEGFRVTTPARAIVECAAVNVDQEVVDSAVAEALDRGIVSRRQLLSQAQRLGARAELGIERALQVPR